MDTQSTKTTKEKKKPRKKAQTKQYQDTKIHYLKELQPKPKNSYTIKVKALRVWKTYYMDAPSKANEINETIWGAPVPCYNINMILMDEEGTKIHACANYYTIFKTSSEKPLKEGAQLIISNFNCVTNTTSLKLTQHDAKIYFTKNTSVSLTDDFKSLNDGFEFVSFESIINNRINKAKAFDVVGQIVSNKKLKQVTMDGRPTSLIEYELQNPSGQKIACVLWGDDADNLQDYINKNITTTEPIVIIIQLAKINIWEGSQQVSSINKASKIYINNNNKHISLFKERLQNNISNTTCGKPHVKLYTTLEDKRHENVSTNKTKNKRDLLKMNGYNHHIIIIGEDSEDEKEQKIYNTKQANKTKQNKRCKNNKYGEDNSHEEKGIRNLEIKNTPIEISDDDKSPQRIITKINYNEKERNHVYVIDDEDDLG